jgi:hypothetical protein
MINPQERCSGHHAGLSFPSALIWGTPMEETATPLLQPVAPTGMPPLQARLLALREALAAQNDLIACRQMVPPELLGSVAEVAEAERIITASIRAALDRCSEADIAQARTRGWLSVDEAARAVKEKRLRELARGRDGKQQGGRER